MCCFSDEVIAVSGTNIYALIFVDIRPTPEVLAQFAPAYFERAEARVYARANPHWRENGSNVAFWFRFTPRNLTRLARTIWRKRRAARYRCR